jgi:hypothetical protein
LTELTQPLSASASQAPAAPHAEPHATVSGTPSFTELVYAHSDWWHELQQTGVPGQAAARYRATLARFQKKHGEIVTAYWCTEVHSAAALTERKRALPFLTPVSTFHRESDWATRHAGDVARELYRCDELAIRAKIVLKGVRQRICLRLVMASASHLLSLVDGRAARTNGAATTATLEAERHALDETDKYYCSAANGQAQIIYFAGMAAVAAVIAVIVGLLLAVHVAGSVYAALIAGAAGGVVSVVQRINAGKFDLEYDVGRPYAFFLGGLRPLIGGAFALAIAFAFKSGVLHLPIRSDHSPAEEHFALVVIAFLAGFSERFAQDTLAAAAQTALPPTSPKADSSAQK